MSVVVMFSNLQSVLGIIMNIPPEAIESALMRSKIHVHVWPIHTLRIVSNSRLSQINVLELESCCTSNQLSLYCH